MSVPFPRAAASSLSLAAGVLLALPALPLGAQSPLAAQPARRLTLADAVALAQRQGYAVSAAIDARDAARYRVRAFNGRLLPQLGVFGTVPSISRQIQGITQPDGTIDFRPVNRRQSNVGMTVSQTLPWTGTEISVQSLLNYRKESATELWNTSPVVVQLRQSIFRLNTTKWDMRRTDLEAEVADKQYLEEREQAAINVTTGFFDAYIARLSVENAAANVLVNDTLYTLSKGRLEVGKIGENDLLQSELALLRSRAALDDARLAYDRALATLRIHLALPAGTPLEVVAPDSLPDIAPDTVRAVAEALRNRSQIQELELQDVQAKRGIAEARFTNSLAFTVNAGAGLNQSAPELNDAYRQLLNQQSVSVGIQAPLVQWGAHRADVQAAKASQSRVRTLARQSREQLAQEAHFAALTLVQSRRAVDISAKADTVAAKRFEVAKNRYVIGKIGIDNLYIAQSEKDQARQAYGQALRGYWLAYYRLRRSTLYDFGSGAVIR